MVHVAPIGTTDLNLVPSGDSAFLALSLTPPPLSSNNQIKVYSFQQCLGVASIYLFDGVDVHVLVF